MNPNMNGAMPYPHQMPIGGQPQPRQPVPPQAPLSPEQQQQLAVAQKFALIRRQLSYIKSECHQAVHPTVIRDRLRDLIEVMEFMLFGGVSNAQPNLIPGVPAGAMDDPSKTKVEFFAGPGTVPQGGAVIMSNPFTAPPPPPAARTPVNNGDVQFIQGPPAGSPGAVGGQTVEYYNGPNHPGDAGAQKVEFFGAPPQQAATPVSNQPAQIVAPPPTLTTEAGHAVAPIPGGHGHAGLSRPAVPPELQQIFPGIPLEAAPPPPVGVPLTEEQARSVMPIPLAE